MSKNRTYMQLKTESPFNHPSLYDEGDNLMRGLYLEKALLQRPQNNTLCKIMCMENFRTDNISMRSCFNKCDFDYIKGSYEGASD